MNTDDPATLCSGLRLLVVEDHEVQRRLTVRLLSRLGAAQVLAADGGRAALGLVQTPGHDIDIVVTDIAMPDMDGVELARGLLALGSRAALVLHSADAQRLAQMTAMLRPTALQLLGGIAKPLNAQKLAPLVRQYRAARP